MSGVSVDASGRLWPICIDDSDRPHVHFSFGDVEIRSSVPITDLSPETLHPFSFPPPFNTYLVPIDAAFVCTADASSVIERMHRLTKDAIDQWKTRIARRTDTGPVVIAIKKCDDGRINDDSDEEELDGWSDAGRDEEEDDDLDPEEPDAQDGEQEDADADGTEDIGATDDGDELIHE